MSIFRCNDPSYVVSSQPSIPVILKGKKRQHNKSQLGQHVDHSPHRPSIMKQNTIISHPPPIQHPHQISFNSFRPSSVPRRLTIHQPISHEQLMRNQYNMQMRQQSRPPQNPKNNINNKKSSTNGDDIRKSIDQKLQKAYQQLRERKSSPNIQNYQNIHNIQINKIRIQQQLVEDYIKLIYKDYSIPDPLENDYRHRILPPKGSPINYIEQSVDTQPNRRPKRRGSTMMSGSTNKKAVQLKQSFLIQMFSPVDHSPINNSNDRNPTKSNNNSNSNSVSRKKSANTAQVSVANPFVYNDNLTQIAQVNQKQVVQAYRFCFICEEPILQANIDIHQRQKCPQFCHLYSMNLQQIRQILIKKIMRLKQQTEQLYLSVFQNQKYMKGKIQNLKKQARRYLGTIDTNIKRDGNNKIKVIPTPIWKNQVKDNFSNVMKSYEQNYFILYENLRKLQWFILMLKNLQEKYHQQSKIQNESQLNKKTQRQIYKQNRRFSVK